MRTDLRSPATVQVVTDPPGAPFQYTFRPARNGDTVDLDITGLPECTVRKVIVADSSPEPVPIFELRVARAVRAGDTVRVTLGPEETSAILTAFFQESAGWISEAIAADPH